MTQDLYAALKKIFHEPNRMAIVSSLLDAPEGMRFGDIKKSCGLTDGNLSRHLKSLESENVVRIEKTFNNSKPQTTVSMTDEGRQKFLDYLTALESVLKRAKKAMKASAKDQAAAPAVARRRSPKKA